MGVRRCLRPSEDLVSSCRFGYNETVLEQKRHIGRILAARRELLGLTQTELARRMGKAQSFVTRLEGGKRDPRWETLLEFARALELEPMLVPRERIPAVEAVLRLSASDDVPPLAGGEW